MFSDCMGNLCTYYPTRNEAREISAPIIPHGMKHGKSEMAKSMQNVVAKDSNANIVTENEKLLTEENA